MGQALYRSHRPKKLSEVVGQEHVTTALSRALKNGTIAHAYLLTGPRGTGKTSIARILAHEVNDLPYEDDSTTHLDIIEIDAASNRRIDEIRELRDKVHIAPTSAKYKVYIIDEVHMLTKEAFNALLKTLEEPPAHVIFMLATTEAHKLPETIISRTQRFALKPIDLTKVAAHLKDIAETEKITVDDDALQLIAAHGEGSFRDSISLLDQVRNSGDTVTLSAVQATLGIAPKELIEALLAAISAHDAPLLVQHLQAAHAGGHEPARMAKQLGEALRSQLLEGTATLSHDLLLQLLSKLIEVPASNDPKSNLEVALLDVALAGAPAPKTKVMQHEVETKPAVQVDHHPAIARKRATESTEAQGASAASSNLGDSTEAEPEKSSERPADNSRLTDDFSARERSPKSEEDDSEPQSKDELNPDIWPAVLTAIKKEHNTLYSVVRTTRPIFAPGQVTLECDFAFHQKKLNEKSTKQVIAKTIEDIAGHKIIIKCTVAEATQLPPADEKIHTVSTPKPQTEEVTAISNIFGGAELLES